MNGVVLNRTDLDMSKVLLEAAYVRRRGRCRGADLMLKMTQQ